MITLANINLATISPQELGEILINAKKAYYTGGKPIMDDATYDTLEEILRQKAPFHRLFSKVGNPNFDTGFDKKKHTMPMGSQNKVKSYPELIKYFELKKIPTDTQFVVQPKCDGLSLEIEYQEGRVIDAVTRGDGFIGDVITQNTVKMQNFKEVLSQPFTGSIRCEIVVTYTDFEKLNVIARSEATKQSQNDVTPTYSNPRNAASGISQRLDGKYTEYCTLMAVDIFPTKESFKITTEQSKIDFLKTLGLTPVDSYTVSSIHEIEQIYQRFFEADRTNYPFDIDGLVIKISNLSLQQDLGSRDNRPKGQVAYKFPARSSETRLLSVAWQTGPYGLVTPVAQVDPIEISGAVINFASLSNYELVKEMDLNIGDIVEISRRGDVIPHIEKVISKVTAGILDAPIVCPVCDTPLIIDNKFLRCPNILACPAQSLGTLRLFCATLDIKGVSDKTIEKLAAAGKIKFPGDFYNLTVDDFINLEGLGEKSGTNIVREIQAKRQLTLVQAFDAAAIPNFSAARIRQVIEAGFDTASKILSLDIPDLESIPGFQTTLATKIVTGLQQRLDSINSILSQITIESAVAKSDSKISGKSFAITGELSRPRKELEDLIIQNGGKAASSVTRNTDYLITNEVESNSSKFVTAKKLNIPIITENALLEMIGES